jgi:2-polyprenyl-3-methyl-5-hydroxy-6-metoxy-1,4-benzoquinol methylase
MREADIRPEGLLKRYLQLSAEDAEYCFSDVEREERTCVGCGSTQTQYEFNKNGFAYASCKRCRTLYQTPRPLLHAFEAFYRDSVSSRYWAEKFFPAVAEVRREKIFRPRAERLSQMCITNSIVVNKLVDVGAGYGILLDEWRRINPTTELLAIEPSPLLAEVCRAKGLNVIESTAENVVGYRNYADLVVCFEVLEHVYDPLSFIKSLSDLARIDGYVFISTLSADGFDIQLLWENSNSIFPPHHINFLSIEGFRCLFERAGLEVISISTPGLLDVEIVCNAYRKNPEFLGENRFIRKLISDDSHATEFQKFLSENRLSSHAWIFAKKVREND